MTLKEASSLAKIDAKKLKLTLAVCIEGPHADDYAELDADGNSYGYCPVESVSDLYRYGKVVEIVKPSKK